jgi:ubiquinone biosynthesis protein
VVSAAQVEFGDLLMPLTILLNLPWILAVAWVARRLLGLGPGRLSSTLVAGIAGWLASGGIAVLALRHHANASTYAVMLIVSGVLFTMLAVVGLELAARPRPGVPSGRVPHPVRNVRGRIARVRRYVAIARIAARHGLRIRRGDDPTRLPVRQVRLAFEEAGGMFVKLGQMLAGRPDVVGSAMAIELGHLHEDVEPSPADAVGRLLEEELGARPDDVFLTFERRPVAAASIAQAYRATLRDGTRVVVKVQRPGVRHVVERDLSILRRAAMRAEERTAWGRSAGVGGIAREFADAVLRELDFAQEATNVEEVAAALAATPEVHVPKVYRELSTTRVLVLEELDGVSVAQRERLAGLGIDREKLADVLLRTSLGSVMNGERFHADPHPGNVMVLSDGRLGLLDLGSTGRLDAIEQASIAGMLTAIHDNDPELLRDSVLEIATMRRPIEERVLDRALARFMARHLGRGAVPNLAMLNDLAQTFFGLGLVLPSSTTLLFRMLVTLEVTLTTLCPGYPVIRAAKDFAPEVIRERLGEASIGDRLRDEAVAMLPVLRRVPRRLDRIATMVERGQLRTSVSLFATERDVAVVGRWVNRLIIGLVGASVGVLSVLLLGLSGGPVVSGSVTLFDVFGYVGLGLSSILLLRVVAAALKEESGDTT